MKTAKAIKPWTPEEGEKFELYTQGNVSLKIYLKERRRESGETFTAYQVADFTQGKRRMVTCKNIAKARATAARLASQIALGKNVAAGMTNTQAASFGRSMELIRKTGQTLEHVCATYAKAYELVGDKVFEACSYYHDHGAANIVTRTVSETITELLQNREARGKSNRYLADLRARLNRFAKACGGDISNVTTADVQTWLDGMKLAPRTLKNFRCAVSTLFKFAQARHYIAKGSNPVPDTERIETNGDGDVEIFTVKEITDLLANASKDFLPFVAIGAFAGLRSAEIERLEWKDIDLAGGHITVAAHKTKTATRRLAPVLPNLAQWLAKYAKRRGKVWAGTPQDLIDARAATVQAAGIKTWKANGLRHSYASYRLADIQDAAKVALEMGNSPSMIFRHYRELVKPEQAKGYFAIAPKQPENVVTMKQEAAA